MFDQIEMMRDFFTRGGPVLVSIFILSIILWILILERYYFLYRICPNQVNNIVKKWQERQDHSSWYALKIKDGLVSEVSTALKQNLIPIQTLTGILPLLGLLGTVTGMISIFEVLNVFGTGNARGMAEGISRALLPTTAGLATSIVGVYFSADLNKRAATREMMAKDALTTEKSTNKIQDLLTQ
ncbi:MAG TPA: biopolymer transporter ExbB [Gammaproteobacteria bacterium]|nr:biopolymer transporter ExbB [Gammaproteobacteria bacterium]|tara:strand:+ start:237 stop:788 length:552 start_codon:yes stop_codon:yes gene_type:complete